MALTYLNSQMIEIPASIANLAVNSLTANNLFYTTFNAPVLSNVNLWDSVYTTVQPNSANWNNTYIAVETNSADWNLILPTANLLTTVVNENSANWNLILPTVSLLTALQDLSSNWEATYEVVNNGTFATEITSGLISALSTSIVEIDSILTNNLTLTPLTATIPTLSTDNGNKGSIKWDSDYLYICIDENAWKRVALSAW
jgi:hypothetical protein